jgi:hypothetical protein
MLAGENKSDMTNEADQNVLRSKAHQRERDNVGWPSGKEEKDFIEAARKQHRDHPFNDFYRKVNLAYLENCSDIELLWFIEAALDLLKARNMKLEIRQ